MSDESFEEHFRKIFTFRKTPEYILPEEAFKVEKWSIPDFQFKKKQLNDVKSLLGKYKLKVWSKHTSNRDPAGFVIKKISENVYPELLTQAWCKFYEILGRFPVVPGHAIQERKFKSVHLCEAPGAFVCSLNHYLVLRYPDIEWKWMATTLNPNHEGNELSQMIPDDRFIRHTLEDWYFGEDRTGDILKFYNHLGIVDHEFCRDKISLVTADGSVDCMKDPGEQERKVEYLHYAETVTSLSILRPGGTYVLKIFTMFEESTINLLYLLNCTFETVSVFKPCSSKSGNSEVYVVSLNYKGLDCLKHLWPTILACFIKRPMFSSKSMFQVKDLPIEFLDDVNSCIDFFMKMQTNTIRDNIYHFENRIRDNIFVKKSCIAQLFINKYNLRPIRNEKRLVPDTIVCENWRVYPSPFRPSFIILTTLNVIKTKWSIDLLQILIGKRINRVKNSKFTHKDNLTKLTSNFGQRQGFSELYNLAYSSLEDKNIIINMKSYNVHFFYKFQRDIFDKILESLNHDKNIIFLGIPFVTHFLLGIFYLLTYAFKNICFGNGVILLYQRNPNLVNNVKDLFSIIRHQYETLDKYNICCEDTFHKDIVQVVPPYYFDQDDSVLLNFFWNYNNRLFHPESFTRPISGFSMGNRSI